MLDVDKVMSGFVWADNGRHFFAATSSFTTGASKFGEASGKGLSGLGLAPEVRGLIFLLVSELLDLLLLPR